MLRRIQGLALLVAFCGLALTVVPVLAANPVHLEILDEGQPVAGARVEILASTGMTQHLTNEAGRVSLDLEGRQYRLRVNGVAIGGVHTATPDLVTIELSN